MELHLRGKLTREEGLSLWVGPYIRRRTIYYLKYSPVVIFLLSLIVLERRGATEVALREILTLSSFLLVSLAILLLFGVARIYHVTKDQEYETHLILTPQMVTMETLGVRQSVPVNLLSIQNARRGVIATVRMSGGPLCKGGVLFFVPERALSGDDRAKLCAMYGLTPLA